MWLIRDYPYHDPPQIKWEVGYYEPPGTSKEDWYCFAVFAKEERTDAETLCHYLNGGNKKRTDDGH